MAQIIYSVVKLWLKVENYGSVGPIQIISDHRYMIPTDPTSIFTGFWNKSLYLICWTTQAMSQVKGTFLISKRMKDESRFPRDHFMAGINHPQGLPTLHSTHLKNQISLSQNRVPPGPFHPLVNDPFPYEIANLGTYSPMFGSTHISVGYIPIQSRNKIPIKHHEIPLDV